MKYESIIKVNRFGRKYKSYTDVFKGKSTEEQEVKEKTTENSNKD